MSDKTTTTPPKYDGDDIFMQAMEGELGNTGAAIATPIIALVNKRDESIRAHVRDALEEHAVGIDDLTKISVMDLRSSNDDFRDEIIKKLRTGFKAIFDNLDERQAAAVNLTKRGQDIRGATIPVRDVVMEATEVVDRISSKSGSNTSSADIADLESKIEAIKLAQASYDERMAAIEKRLGAIETGQAKIQDDATKARTAAERAEQGVEDLGKRTTRNEEDINRPVTGIIAVQHLHADVIYGREADETYPAQSGLVRDVTNLKADVAALKSSDQPADKTVALSLLVVMFSVAFILAIWPFHQGFVPSLAIGAVSGLVAFAVALTFSGRNSRNDAPVSKREEGH